MAVTEPGGQTSFDDAIDEGMTSSLRALFPGPVGAAARCLSRRIYPLFPQEAEAVSKAVESRRLEFADGRSCARIAMRCIGQPACAVPSGTDRSPVWPSGIVGSITHGGGICAAVAASRRVFAGIGIDAEAIGAVSPDLLDEVMRRDEIAAHGRHERRDGIDLATLYFCTKEAAYKTYYPLTREVLEFGQMHIVLHPREPAFAARAVTEFGRRVRLSGRYFRSEDAVIAAAWAR